MSETWTTVTAARVLYVDEDVNKIVCDRLPSPVTLLLKDAQVERDILAEPPTYHDLHLSMNDLPRTSIFDLPFNVVVHCTRSTGWQVWHRPDRDKPEVLLASEYTDTIQEAMILDVAGHVIVDSLTPFIAAIFSDIDA